MIDDAPGDLSVDVLGPGDVGVWDGFARARPGHGIYHTEAWRRILEHSYGFEPLYLVARRSSRIVEGLPLFSVRHPLLPISKLVSTPFNGCSPAFLGDDRAAQEAIVDRAVAIARERSARYLEIRTDAELPWLEERDFAARRPLAFPRLLLSDRESTFRRLANSHRGAVKQASRLGVEVSQSDQLADLATFYRIMLDLFQGFGSPTAKLSYFEQIWRELGARDECRLLVARHEERVLGAGLFFFCNRRAVYKNSACAPDSLRFRPYNALVWRAIEMAIERGVEEMDLGATSPADTGLLQFKLNWGAEPRRPVYYYHAVSGHFPELEQYFDAYAWQKAIWRRLPRALVARIGPLVTAWVC